MVGEIPQDIRLIAAYDGHIKKVLYKDLQIEKKMLVLEEDFLKNITEIERISERINSLKSKLYGEHI